MSTATQPLTGKVLLRARGVSKIYGREPKQFTAIKGIELDVRRGEFVCLLGPSGCGKSTLLRILTGLNTASAGTVRYRGKPLVGVNPKATIVFQTFALYPWLTVRENVEIALKAHGVDRVDRKKRALQLIDQVGLDGFEAAYPRELSGGMRQKVGFARAMAVEPELLCLDEPFSALDVLSAEALRGELMELWLGKAIPTLAILMVTHNIEEAVLMADRIVVMGKNPGHIVMELKVGLRQPRVRKDTAFQALVDQVYAAVAGHTPVGADEAAVPGRYGKALPKARPNAVAGLVEKLKADGGRMDLPKFGLELQLELDDLLPVVEAGELAGLVTVSDGDLFLTELGNTYADASILARKELIAGRMLRVPMVRWIYETLQKDDNQRTDREYFVAKLQDDFGERAGAQLERAIDWGRFAELFSYDAATNELFLES